MRQIKKGSADIQVNLHIMDLTDGSNETGVAYNTGSLALWYRRDGAVKTAITPAQLTALTNAHLTGGILHISDGDYRLDLPDASVVTGVDHICWGGSCTAMLVLGGEAELVDDDMDGVSARLPTALTAGGNIKADALKVNGATPLDAAATADAVLDEVITGTLTLRQLGKILAAFAVGKTTGGNTTTLTFRDIADTTNVIVETVDADGNRSAVVLTLT